MTTINANGETTTEHRSWTEYCEQHAAVSALEFARYFRVFIQESTTLSEHRPSPEEFARRYVQHFLEHFEFHTQARCLVNAITLSSSSNKNTHNKSGPDSPNIASDVEGGQSDVSPLFPAAVNTSTDDDHGDYADSECATPRHRKSFFRRFSIRTIRGKHFRQEY